MSVRPASRMLSAISFGVFWRSAPSTSAIMRSRKVSPGFDVMRTMIWSESTRVPPVTAERSPPDSRITGADSPVIADSSTDAMPSMISPSPGISSPAGTTHSSPTASSPDAFVVVEPSGRRTRATVSARVLRSVSACALPRPSATASAKFANSTVNHSHAETSPANTLSDDVAERQLLEEQDRREDAADLDDEHHRVARHLARVELHERVADRAPHDRGVEHRRGRRALAHLRRARLGCGLDGHRSGSGGHGGAPQNFPTRCSTMGPSAMTGK